MRLSSRIALATLLSITSFGCAPAKPLPGGPPPEYEAPRTIPGDSAAPASSTSDIGVDDEMPFGSVKDLTTEIDSYMAGYGAKYGEAYAPSGSVAVVYGGKIVFSRNYGKADRKSGAAPNTSTQFRIGSLTKMFTATATLKLAEKHQLDLADSITKYVPELPDAYKDVTLDALLHQVSGVPAYTDDPAMLAKKNDNTPETDILDWLAKHPPAFKVGSKWEYSNSNYYLLGVVVERVSKTTLEAFMKTAIFDPAGMHNASVQAGTGPVASGYSIGPLDKLVDADAVSPTLPMGAGFLYASVNDFVAWDAALYGNGVLSADSKTKMWTGNLDLDPAGKSGKKYGMAWILEKRAETDCEWHNGSIDGFGSYFGRAPNKHVAVVVLSNVFQFNATRVGQDILGMAIGGSAVPAPTERDTVVMNDAYGKAIAGDYTLTADSEKAVHGKVPDEVVDSIKGFTITYDGGNLIAKPSGQTAVALHHAKDGPLFNAGIGVEVTPDFGTGEPGDKAAGGFTFKQGGLALSYARGKYTPAPPKDPKKPDPKKADPHAPKAGPEPAKPRVEPKAK